MVAINSGRKAFVVLLFIFALGILCGIGIGPFFYRPFYPKHLSHGRDAMVSWDESHRARVLQRLLKLDDAQTQKLLDTFKRHRKLRRDLGRELMERCGTETMSKERERMRAEIRSLLTESQQTEFEKLENERGAFEKFDP